MATKTRSGRIVTPVQDRYVTPQRRAPTTRSSTRRKDTPRSLDYSDVEDEPSETGRTPSSVRRKTVTTRGGAYGYAATPRDALPGVKAPGVQTEMKMHQETTVRVLDGRGKSTPEPLYGLDEDDEDQEIDTTTMVSVSQGSPQHTMYTTSDDGSFDENDGVVAVVSAWFMSLAEYIGRFFTGETAVLSQVGSGFSQVSRGQMLSGTFPYVWLVLLLSLIVSLSLFLSPIYVSQDKVETKVETKSAGDLIPGDSLSQDNLKEAVLEDLKNILHTMVHAEVHNVTQTQQEYVVGNVTKNVLEHLRKPKEEQDEEELNRTLSKVFEKLQSDSAVQGLNESEVERLIVAKLKDRKLVDENEVKIVDYRPDSSASATDGVNIEDLKSQLRQELSKTLVDDDVLLQKITESVMKKLENDLREVLSTELETEITETLTDKSTKFQEEFLANYTAINTEAMKDILSTVQADVKKAVEEAVAKVRHEMAERLADQIQDEVRAKVNSIGDEVTRVTTKLSDVDSSLNDVLKRTTDLESKSATTVQKVESMETGIQDMQQNVAGLGHDEGQLTERIAAVEKNQTNKEMELSAVVDDIQALANSLNETVLQHLVKALVNITELHQDYEFFTKWLDDKYINEPEFRERMRNIVDGMPQNFSPGENGQLDSAWVKEFVLREVQKNVTAALDKYSADQTGKADFALESGGGSIIDSRTSPTYNSGSTFVTVYGLQLWSVVNPPRTVIQPGALPGQCWAFTGNNGSIVIRLSNTVLITGFTYEHVPANLTNGDLSSTPKDILVYGLDDERDENGTRLSSYKYLTEASSLQYFPVEEAEVVHSFRYVLLNVLTNYGNDDYTCLYRFRVHGRVQGN
ncbi:klaroid protein-like isoform X2 [Corticium candelabrum]|uniref:klaroid protein-like isoform X2 n=1 Tax=Corticium candelabrum TaxID=121492 RepID=UPI002E31A5AE|nr:klaroid protein-like isoform X2 [Corticium candelabrum]